ncbi:MAG: hypothetical protein LBD55_08365, partial [Treponema sp.]|nr:hypothetical protein [Treponema sp.]
GLFGARGLPLARAGNLALFYIAEQMEAGRISITKAGIIDRRGQPAKPAVKARPRPAHPVNGIKRYQENNQKLWQSYDYSYPGVPS